MTVDAFTLYDLGVGLLTGVGLVYLLYLERNVVRYRRVLLVVTAGVLTFSVASPAVELIAPGWVHVVHGLAALLVIVGLYTPVHRIVQSGGSLTMLVRDPATIRLPPSWMSPMDDDILELFHSADLVLTPTIIAYNLGYSREEVNRHLSELQEHGIVDRIERGKYCITPQGERYLEGQLRGTSVRSDAGEPAAEGRPYP
ncbi:MAG: ArsR family transcriptional regulator [Salinigranum sp.]